MITDGQFSAPPAGSRFYSRKKFIIFLDVLNVAWKGTCLLGEKDCWEVPWGFVGGGGLLGSALRVCKEELYISEGHEWDCAWGCVPNFNPVYCYVCRKSRADELKEQWVCSSYMFDGPALQYQPSLHGRTHHHFFLRVGVGGRHWNMFYI